MRLGMQAHYAQMTGSGSTVFGLFEEQTSPESSRQGSGFLRTVGCRLTSIPRKRLPRGPVALNGQDDTPGENLVTFLIAGHQRTSTTPPPRARTTA